MIERWRAKVSGEAVRKIEEIPDRSYFKSRVDAYEAAFLAPRVGNDRPVLVHRWRYTDADLEDPAWGGVDYFPVKLALVMVSFFGSLMLSDISMWFLLLLPIALVFAIAFPTVLHPSRLTPTHRRSVKQAALAREDARVRARKTVIIPMAAALAYEDLVMVPARLRAVNASDELVGQVESLLPVAEELVTRLAEAGEDAILNPQRHSAYAQLVRMASEACALHEAAVNAEEARKAAARLALPPAEGLPVDSLLDHGVDIIAEQREMVQLQQRLNSD